MTASKLHDLQEDVARITARIRDQVQKDPDHVVALAMFNADLERAEFQLQEYVANSPHGRLAA